MGLESENIGLPNPGFLLGLYIYKLFERFFIVTPNQQNTYCTMLQVILTPTCRVSGYPRQVIKVDAA
jgi:hypothetical protein